MKHIKKLLPIILILILAISLSGCIPSQPSAESDKLRIVTTIFPQYDIARTIAGDNAKVTMLIPPGSEIHSFEPTTSDILSITQCDVFIYTGGESDSWVDKILSTIESEDITLIRLMDCVKTEDHHHHHSGHSHSITDAHTDEHVWTSVKNTKLIATEICERLCALDTSAADAYRENLKTFNTQLDALDEDFRNVIQNAKRNQMVFADRYPLTHFSEEYGLEYIAAFPGCSEDTEASAATVAKLIDTVNSQDIPVILKIELSSDSIAKTVQAETGAEVMTFYSCHNISKEDFEKGETYISLMNKNVETLRLALN